MFQSHAFAQSENQSVKEYLEQPISGEEQKNIDENQRNTNEQPEISENTNGVGLTVWDFMKMLFATVFVVALLYFVLKLVNKKGAFGQTSNTLVNLGGLTVGTNRSVQIIKVGERILVVGVGDDIQLLTEIEKGEEFDRILTDYNQKLDKIAKPNDAITRMLELVKGKRIEVKPESSSFQSLLKKQLDEMSKERKNILAELESEKDKDQS